MRELNMSISHGLTQEEAVKRIKNLLNDVKTQFADKIGDLHEEWDGHMGRYNFSVMGLSVSGTVAVKMSQIDISGNLPFAVMLFKGKIESAIKDCAKKLLV